MTTFENIEEYSSAVRDAVREGEDAYNGWREDSCSVLYHVERLGTDEERPLWLPIPGLDTNTHGAGPSETVLVETNENAAIETCRERGVEFGYIGCQFSVLVADLGDTGPDDDALAVITELAEALEDYPLLDDEAYSTECFEQAEGYAVREVADAARELIAEDDTVANRIKDYFGDDIDPTLAADDDSFYTQIDDFSNGKNAAGEWIDPLWEERDCYPHVNAEAVRDCILLAFPARAEDDEGNIIETEPRCPHTLEMF